MVKMFYLVVLQYHDMEPSQPCETKVPLSLAISSSSPITTTVATTSVTTGTLTTPHLHDCEIIAESHHLPHVAYFYMSTIKQQMHQIALQVARTKREKAQIHCQVSSQKGTVFFDTTKRFGLLCLCDDEYIAQTAFHFMEILRDKIYRRCDFCKTVVDVKSYVPQKFLDDELKQAQDPALFDQLFRIEKTLSETKAIMYKNIDEVIRRGITIEELQEKSQDLTENAGAFYLGARKQNKCCKGF